MNEHEKIKISWDEVERVGADAPAPAGTPRSEEGLPPLPPPRRRVIWPWVVGGAGFLLLMLIVLTVTRFERRGQTVDAWVANERPQWAAEISGSATVKKYIEDIHPMVTYKRAAISEMRAVTVDGSNNAGPRGENISEVEVLVTFYWEGPVTKDGFTEVRFNYDYQGRQLKSQRFEQSNAKINLATVDWFKVGVALGTLLY